MGQAPSAVWRREVDQLAVFLAGLVVAEVEFEFVVLGFFVKLDDHLGHKGPAGLGAETVQRADVLVIAGTAPPLRARRCAPPGICRTRSRSPRRGHLHRYRYSGGSFLSRCHRSWGKGACQRGVVTGDGVAVVFFRLFDHVLGHGGDFGHELLAAELALLHLRELVFPLAGQLGLGEFLHVQAAQAAS